MGCIEVECWKAELKSSSWKNRHKTLNFQQANKKDVYKVTSGKYSVLARNYKVPVILRLQAETEPTRCGIKAKGYLVLQG